jgi:hypothetical protein
MTYVYFDPALFVVGGFKRVLALPLMGQVEQKADGWVKISSLVILFRRMWRFLASIINNFHMYHI